MERIDIYIFIAILCVGNVQGLGLTAKYDIGNYKILRRGETLTLECENTLNKFQIQWFNGTKSLYTMDRVTIQHSGTKSWVNIRNATGTDAGMYACKVDYVQSTDQKMIVVERGIEVIVKPEIKVNNTIDPGTRRLVVSCDILSGYPTPIKIKWSFEPDNTSQFNLDDDSITKITLEESIDRWTLLDLQNGTHLLMIENMARWDEGNYTCIAFNLAGEITAMTRAVLPDGWLWIYLGTDQNPPTSDANLKICGPVCIPFILIMVIAFVMLVGLTILSYQLKHPKKQNYKPLTREDYIAIKQQEVQNST